MNWAEMSNITKQHIGILLPSKKTQICGGRNNTRGFKRGSCKRRRITMTPLSPSSTNLYTQVVPLSLFVAPTK